MRLTADQIRPLLSDKLRNALNARAPDSNRTGWMMRTADDLGLHLNTFRNILYGESTPSGPVLVALFGYFPGLQGEVLGVLSP